MSKKLKRSAVALVLAATMVFSSQGVLTAFAAGGDIETGAPVSSALERSLDKVETDVADESGNVNDDPLENVCEICGGVDGQHEEGCSANQQPENTCPVCGGVDGQHTEDCTANQQPDEGDSGETTCPVCGGVDGQHTEDCTANQQPDEGDSGETTCPECGGIDGQHEENCSLAQESDNTPSEEDVAAAKNVSDLIGALPEASTLDPETTDVEALTAQVKAAREAYDKLTDAQKALVEKAVLDKLVALEGALEALQNTNVAAEGDVAKVGGAYYSNIDDAIENALENSTIELLLDDPDKTVEPTKTFYKSLTFTGTGTLKYDIYGWRYNGNLTFDGPNVALNCTTTSNAKAADNGEAGEWFIMVLNGSLNFTNGAKGTFSFDSKISHTSQVTTCAIFMNKDSEINITNQSSLKILGTNTAGVAGQALQLDGDYDAYLNVKGKSTFLIDGTNRGYVHSPIVYVEDSLYTIQNCTNNASNGGTFTAIRSEINFKDNAVNGLSATNLTISDNSTVICDGNGGYGIAADNVSVDGTSSVQVTNNATMNGFAGFMIRYSGTISEGATVIITGNQCKGLYLLYDSCEVTIEEGVDLTITDNYDSNAGGGIRNQGKSLSLPSNAVIFNNHAANAGDDIYCSRETSTLTFGKVGSDWVLDDTNLPITNWFYDGKKDGEDTNRWSVGNYYEVFTPGAITGLQAIKAAHQYSYNPDTPTIPDGDFEWETSKSKHAEELEKQADGTYTSNVTLSLPAADFEPEIDVVFVIDDTHAGSGIFAGSVKKLLNELRAKDNLDVNIGVVTFDAIARDWLQVTSNGELSGLVSLNENYDAILKAINTELTEDGEGTLKKLGGSNTEWPLAMANEMLSRGNGSEQHVVMFSDMFGYVYRGDLIVGDTTYHDVPLSKKLGNSDKGQLCISSPKYDTWEDVKNHIDEDEPQYDTFFRDPQWESYWTNYGVGEVPDINLAPKASVPQYGEGLVPYSYITPFEKSCYLTYSEAIELMNNGVHLTFINNDFNPGDNGETIQTIRTGMLQDLASNGATFIQKETANGATLDENQMEEVFTALENKLLYVVDAGSQVIDVIGEGKDNKGNDYNFDFVDVVSLIVGGEEYEIHHEEGSDIYYFGTSNEDGVYPFVLTYYPDGFGVSAMNNEDNEDSIQEIIAGELFIWDINVPITVDEPVQLTYTVKLTNPQTAYGTYGEYDANGKNGSTSLYTNNSAILYPVDSTGARREEEAFLKPTVSYTVDNDNDNPGTDPTPDPDPDPDRPSRPNRDDDDDWEPLPNAPVKDKPTTEVDVPEETETPTTEQPDKYNPETGDTTTVFAAMALAAVSLGGIALLGRKKK